MVAEGKVVSPTQLNRKYAADAADAKGLTSWLKSEGFKIEKISADRTSIYAEGTVEQIQKSLHVKMMRVTKDGITYTAAQDAPSLPASVGKSVSNRRIAAISARAQAIPDLYPAKRRNRAPSPGEARSSQTCGGRPEQEGSDHRGRSQRISRVANSEGLQRRRSFRDRQGPDDRHPD
jgi:hypothetical protein